MYGGSCVVRTNLCINVNGDYVDVCVYTTREREQVDRNQQFFFCLLFLYLSVYSFKLNNQFSLDIFFLVSSLSFDVWSFFVRFHLRIILLFWTRFLWTISISTLFLHRTNTCTHEQKITDIVSFYPSINYSVFFVFVFDQTHMAICVNWKDNRLIAINFPPTHTHAERERESLKTIEKWYLMFDFWKKLFSIWIFDVPFRRTISGVMSSVSEIP